MKEVNPGKPLSLTRRRLLGTAAAAAGSLPLFNINHSWSADVHYAGEVFDAGGASIRIAEWGGPWGELVHKHLLNQFAEDFNCSIEYDSSWPWFPKFVAGGPSSPPFAITNWNLPEMFKTAGAGDYFVPIDELRANVPNTNDVWPFRVQQRRWRDLGVRPVRICVPHGPGRSRADGFHVVLGGSLCRQARHLHHVQHPPDGVLRDRRACVSPAISMTWMPASTPCVGQCP